MQLLKFEELTPEQQERIGMSLLRSSEMFSIDLRAEYKALDIYESMKKRYFYVSGSALFSISFNIIP